MSSDGSYTRFTRERDAFHEWVIKHDIGPGMNDGWRGRSPPPSDYEPVVNYSGFDGIVGPGWLPILDRLATDLIAMGWDRDLHQVKEKFGGLRFYIGQGTEEMWKRIEQAEAEAYKTCEECGAPGKVTTKGWRKTLCPPCTEKRYAQYNITDDDED